jgi:hypothetical protein
MILPFFTLAMIAPNRQRSFRTAVVAHAVLVAAVGFGLLQSTTMLPVAGQVFLVAGIVEGAIVVGWRLTQVPKSQSLEFLLVSPVQPKRVYRGEAAVGLARLALVTLTGAPILLLLAFAGRIRLDDLAVLLVIPLTWGAVTGLGLAAWAYESRIIRRWGEVVTIAGIVLYLLVGVLAGENLRLWLTWLPADLRWWLLELFAWGHNCNPFGVMHYWFDPQRIAAIAASRLIGLQVIGIGMIGLLGLRGSARLRGHFHDRHYRPFTEVVPDTFGGVGERPLAWWTVRRVMEYSGGVNLWLAGGFGILYAAYVVAGDRWPPWMGRLIFQLVEEAGGIPALAAGLAILAAVPACFQYGLWDASAQDRCRRLELLLLTDLNATDFWDAAAAAAWRRGRGYFAVAAILWLAAGLGGRAAIWQLMAAVNAAVILWGFSFALGFRAFARGRQASGLGSLMTLGLPLVTVGLAKLGVPQLSALTPPGSVCYAMFCDLDWTWAIGPFVYGIAALVVGRLAWRRCEQDLRDWLDKNSGRKLAD